MTADPTVTVAIVTAGASLLAQPLTWWLARRKNHAEVRAVEAAAEVSEVQAEQMRADIWAKLQTSLTAELDRQRAAAHAEIDRLGRQLREVSTRLATVELALVEKSAKLRATEIERDRLREREAALTAEVATLQAQVAACRSCVLTATHTDPGSSP